jgi:hypothetical protein
MRYSRWIGPLALLGAALTGGIVALALWDENPGHTPTVLITAAVALLVAAITAVTTDRRQAQQLAHERVMQDLEELRGVLDTAASAATDLVEERFARLAALSAAGAADRTEQSIEWWGLFGRATRQWRRLELRLGEHHEAARLYGEAIEVLRARVVEFSELARAGGHGDEITALAEEGRSGLRTGIRAFIAEGRNLVGSAQEIVSPELAKHRTIRLVRLR